MNRRAFLFVTMAAAVSGCTAVPRDVALAPNSTILLVRHGDRSGDDLSPKGIARAQALVSALNGMALDAIYSPGIRRNLDTARPLALARGLPIQRRPQENPTARLVQDAAGKSVIWVGNKGNITAIWDGLQLDGPAPLEYGDLFILRSDAAGVVTIERRFFGPT